MEEKFSFALNPLLTFAGASTGWMSDRGEALVIDYKYSAGNKIRERVEDTAEATWCRAGCIWWRR